ncbi:MAG: cation:proton antiporter subunit C [Chitinispirillaceae bacterium]|nr:cation:proton antiporter subunit C [Chitinispirillaceae bacterium]
MTYFLCMIIFAVGLYAVVAKRNMIKIIIGIMVMEYALNMLFVLFGYRQGGRSPILERFQEIKNIVDPLPQALILTAIVIGLATTALMVALAVRIYEKYGTFDITKIRKLRG